MRDNDKQKRSIEVFNHLAEAYQEKFMDLDMYNDTYDALCAALKPKAKILEIGCGPGNITRYLLHKKSDLDILAIDAAPNMVTLTKRNNPSARTMILSASDVSSLAETFDAVVCGFCMPYLPEEGCRKLFKDCSRLLNDEGLFYFSTIEGDYKQSKWETSSDGKHSAYVHYYSGQQLLSFLNENGFSSLRSFRKNYAKADGSPDAHLIFIAKKN